MPQFNIEGARKAGYSDDEILQHLTQSRQFDVAGATAAGYSKADILDHLSSTAPVEQTNAAASGNLSLGQTEIKPDSTASWLTRQALSLLPAAGGTIGAIIGAGGGALAGGGLGSIPAGATGEVIGSGVGQAGGEAARQVAARTLYGEQAAPASTREALSNIAREGVIGAGSTLLGTAATPALGRAFRGSAQESLNKLLRMPGQTLEDASRISKITGQMAERPADFLASSRQGLENKAIAVGKDIAAQRAAKEAQVIAEERAGTRIPINWQGVQSDLQQMRAEMNIPSTGQVIHGREGAAKYLDGIMTELQSTIKNHLAPGGPSAASAEDLIHVRKILDRTWRDMPSEEAFKNKIDSAYADSLRREINTAHPDLAKIYNNSHIWQTVKDSMETQRLSNLGKPIPERLRGSMYRVGVATGVGGAGYLFGGPWGGLGGFAAASALEKATSSAAWQTASAAMKGKVASALARNDFQQAVSLLGRIATSKASQPTMRSPEPQPQGPYPGLSQLLQRPPSPQ